MSFRSIIIALLSVAGLQFSHAQASSAFGPQVGFYRSPGASEYRTMGGLALRLKVSERLGIQGSINYRSERYLNNTIRATSWPVLVSGLFYPAPQLFGTIGTGWYNTSIEYSIPVLNPPGAVLVSSEEQQRFGWHFGGGLELPLGMGTMLSGDIKYVFLDYEFKNFPGAGGVNSNFYVISVGLLFGL
jgi:opacity protein-like surface antigen